MTISSKRHSLPSFETQPAPLWGVNSCFHWSWTPQQNHPWRRGRNRLYLVVPESRLIAGQQCHGWCQGFSLLLPQVKDSIPGLHREISMSWFFQESPHGSTVDTHAQVCPFCFALLLPAREFPRKVDGLLLDLAENQKTALSLMLLRMQ